MALTDILKTTAEGAAAGSVVPGWGTAIGAAAGLATGLIGAAKAGKERRRMESYINQQAADNESWYNQNALGDYTQRADVQALLKQTRDALAKRNKASANMAVVTGATPEAVAAQQEVSNNALANTYSNVAALGQRYKDSVTDKYLARKDAIAGQRMGIANQKANSYENLMSNGMSTFGNAADSYLKYLDTPKTK
jgi:gas vesicle protein